MMQTPSAFRHIADIESIADLAEIADRAFGFEGEPLGVRPRA